MTGSADSLPLMLRGLELTDPLVRLEPFGRRHTEAHLRGEDSALVTWVYGRPGTPARVAAYARRSSQDWARGGPLLGFAILSRADGEQVGTLDVTLLHRVEDDDTAAGASPDGRALTAEKLSVDAELAYGIYAKYRGHGYAGAAVRICLGVLAERTEASRAVIRTDERNPASVGVAVANGFVRVGRTGSPRTPELGDLDVYVREL